MFRFKFWVVILIIFGQIFGPNVVIEGSQCNCDQKKEKRIGPRKLEKDNFHDWEEMAVMRIEHVMKQKDSIAHHHNWMRQKGQNTSVHYVNDLDIDYVHEKLQIITVCEPRSLVVLLDATISNIREIADGDIWTALPIFTYQQIAQRLTHAHVNGSEFRTIVAIYGSYRRGVEIVPDLEIIIDKKIKEVSDIENIFKLKLMDKQVFLKRTIKAFYDLATTSSNEHIQENTLSAIRNMSALTAEKNEEGKIPPYHWVIVTNHVQVKHMAFTKEFNIETLTNVKLHSNGSVLLTTSNADGSNRISFISQGAIIISQLEQDVVAWNIELESNFCYIDPQRLLILGYNATYGDNSAYKNDTIRIRNRRFPSRRYLSDHARRYRHVMKMLGEEQSVHRDLNSPEHFELEEKTFSTDYAFIRAGSRGKELTVSDKSDQYAKFFTVGAKQILMPDEDENDLV